MKFVDILDFPEELREGLGMVLSSLKTPKNELESLLKGITFLKDSASTSIEDDNGNIIIKYKTKVKAYKALAYVLTCRLNKRSAEIKEMPQRIENICVMLDFSRNAVMKKETLKDWLCSMALCGINQLILYIEDIYEMPDHKYVGYMRGRYSQNDLKEIDEIADKLGIEVIPNIQTLAHLTRILSYPQYNNIKENKSVLLPGCPETLDFIEQMIKTVSAPFRSNQIHIGMDEAWGLGRGRYRELNGDRPCFDLFIDHLNDVLGISRKLNLTPMMWSDMFFRILSPRGIHYDPEIEWTHDILSQIPKEVRQVYWNYYHSDSEQYSHYIKLHKDMGTPVSVATGIQTWDRFWPAYEHTETTLKACFKSLVSNNISDMIITLWGDDGTECDYFSAIPLLAFTGELDQNETVDMEILNTKSSILTGADYESWKIPSELDYFDFSNKTGRASNWSKALLWDDPAMGLWTAQLEGNLTEDHYRKLVDKLGKLNTKSNDNFLLALTLAQILEIKGDMPVKLREAYKKKDTAALENIAYKCKTELIPLLESLNKIHRRIWQKKNSIFGWEVLERRYGGIKATIENIINRIEEYLSGKISNLEELETEPLKKFDMKASEAYLNSCAAVYSTGQIFHTMDE